jgi:hypothetical protein
MWQDVLAALTVAPLWAQIIMTLFAVGAVASIASGPLRKRRYRRQLRSYASAFGTNVHVNRNGWPATFSATVDGRTFDVQYDYRMSTWSYRGPRGDLLITSTPLAGNAWSMHQIGIEKMNPTMKRLIGGWVASGDATFDAGFMVREDGLAVRSSWLNAPTREAISKFVDQAPLPGPIWVQEGRLQYVMRAPWKNLDDAALKSLLRRQAALADAFERIAPPAA